MLSNSAAKLKDEERSELINYCLNKYGVETSFWNDWDFLKRKEDLWIFPKDQLASLMEAEPESCGLRLFSGKKFPYKVTHHFALLIGEGITKGRIEVSENEARSILFREEVNLCGETAPGYYLTFHKKQFIGIVLLSHGVWTSQVPKSLKAQFPRSLKLY